MDKDGEHFKLTINQALDRMKSLMAEMAQLQRSLGDKEAEYDHLINVLKGAAASYDGGGAKLPRMGIEMIKNSIIKCLADGSTMDRNEIKSFVDKAGADADKKLNEGTFAVQMSALSQGGIIIKYKRGYWRLTAKGMAEARAKEMAEATAKEMAEATAKEMAEATAKEMDELRQIESMRRERGSEDGEV